MARIARDRRSTDLSPLPADVPSEAALLGSMLIDSRCAADVLARLQRSDFVDPGHVDVFETLLACWRDGQPLDDIVLLAGHLAAHGRSVRPADAPAMLAQLGASVTTAAHVEHYCEAVLEASRKRRLALLASDLAVSSRNGHTSGELLDDLSGTVDELRGQLADDRASIVTLNAADFCAADHRQEWLIYDTISASQPGVIAAKSKSLKTTIAIDAAISLATGSQFLGRWGVPSALPCGILSAESGSATLAETLARIAQAKGLDTRDLGQLHVGTVVPTLTTPRGLDALERWISAHRLRCVWIDPTYRAAPGVDDTQLSRMAELLWPLSDIIDRTGCSIVMVHHARKSPARDGLHYEPPTLDDIAGTGWQQWARHWVLLARRREWEPDAGRHYLHLVTGSSAGCGARLWLDVTEGRRSDPGGRRWDVMLTNPSEGVEAERNDRDAKSELRQQDRVQRDADTIAHALTHCPGATATKSELRDRSGVNTSRFTPALALLLGDGRLVRTKLTRGNGREYDALTLGGSA